MNNFENILAYWILVFIWFISLIYCTQFYFSIISILFLVIVVLQQTYLFQLVDKFKMFLKLFNL